MAHLLFGISELDRLLDLKRGRFYDETGDDTLTSIALLGPDGTGKSVLALHLVSRYYADSYAAEGAPTILYISTDLRFEKAKSIWQNFALGIPYERDIPCERASDKWERKRPRVERPAGSFDPIPLSPTGSDMADFLEGRPRNGFGFLDLAASSAGDDWGYVIRALSLLDANIRGHLVVIDSVAGFEMLTGETDAFGERTARRARIAHIMRTAQKSCHIVFVVEESQEGAHLPEEFVTDTVIRLRRRTVGGSMRRTLEIEKSRGRAHASGEHPYGILDGLGSSTGIWENPDEPRSSIWSDPDEPEPGDEKKGPPTNTYVQLYYSLQYRNQRIKARQGAGTAVGTGEVASFGIRYLDEMLAQNEAGDCPAWSENGLWCGKTSSLIGDPGTGKSDLGYSFLCEGFRYYAERLVRLTEAFEAEAFGDESVREACDRLENWLAAGPAQAPVRPTAPGYGGVKSLAAFVGLVKEIDARVRRRVEGVVLGGEKNVLDAANRLRIHQTWLPPRSLNDTSPRKRPLRRVQYPWKWSEQNPEHPLEVADWLLRHPAYASPAVLITTDDVKSDELARRFVQWLEPVLASAARGGRANARDYETMLFNYAAQHLICRRLEAQDATGPLLFHIIEWTLLEAQRLLFGPVLPNIAYNRSSQSWRIRMVIDNFRILRDMYPAVREDPLFLPLLIFYLGRERVTSLIVDTDSGRPDKDPSDEVNRELRSLVTHQLYTWEVPFFGQRRIAIASVPPLSRDCKGVIREVRLSTETGQEQKRPVVDPHFELYSGLEEGKPETVPLKVCLLGETPAFEEYARQENIFFKQVFPSTGVAGAGSDIVVCLGPNEFDALRGFCHMPTDFQLNHSLVFQVDGSWTLTRQGSLKNQYRYLTEHTTDGSGYLPFTMEDPFHLFQPADKVTRKGRIDYFKNGFYRRRVWLTEAESKAPPKQKEKVDRVPFTWDFGFLLCKNDPWELALDKPLNVLNDSVARWEAHQRKASRKPITVESVWKALPKTKDREDQTRTVARSNVALGPADPRSWRAFLEAARVVADTAADRLGHPVQPFDFAAMTGDSVSCLVLEIWFSEIWRSEKLQKTWGRDRITRDVSRAEYIEPENRGLIELLGGDDGSLHDGYERFLGAWQAAPEGGKPPWRDYVGKGYSLELYMTWLLLLEVLDFGSFEHPDDPFDFRPNRTPVQEAIAARHWYKTACVAASGGEKTGHPSELMVAVRLPGHYSARGDWFLATAKGSRSARLAERAIDVLSSRRANILRLQAGLGLPTRDIVSNQLIGQLRTSLRGPNADGIIDNVKYGHLYRTLGASHLYADKHPRVPELNPISDDFYWFYRNGLQDYDRQSRPWRKWLNRLFLWTHHYYRQRRTGWIGGFKPYDQLRGGDYSTVMGFDSFLEFAKMCDLLIAELKAAALDRQ